MMKENGNMNNIQIRKIRDEKGHEYEVNWNFDLEKRRIEDSLISQSLIKSIFGKENIFDIDDINLILFSDEEIYYCYNCIFGFNLFPQFTIHTVSIDYILTNSDASLEKLQTNKYKMIIELPKELESQYIEISKNIIFKYNKFIDVELKKEYIEKRWIMTIFVNSSKFVNSVRLSNIAYNIYELLVIYLGEGIKILKRIFYEDDESKELFLDTVDKYGFGIKNSVSHGNFVAINEKSINKEIITRFEQFKKETYLLNDVFLTLTNLNIYREIKINMMIQVIEGFYKSIIGKAKLHNILDYTFLNNGYYDNLLSKRDRSKVKVGNREDMIFLYKAKNHRNYFSHLNEHERKIVFTELELNYAYWKIYLAYRLLIMKHLGVQYNKEALDKIISKINEYADKYL